MPRGTADSMVPTRQPEMVIRQWWLAFGVRYRRGRPGSPDRCQPRNRFVPMLRVARPLVHWWRVHLAGGSAMTSSMLFVTMFRSGLHGVHDVVALRFASKVGAGCRVAPPVIFAQANAKYRVSKPRRSFAGRAAARRRPALSSDARLMVRLRENRAHRLGQSSAPKGHQPVARPFAPRQRDTPGAREPWFPCAMGGYGITHGSTRPHFPRRRSRRRPPAKGRGAGAQRTGICRPQIIGKRRDVDPSAGHGRAWRHHRDRTPKVKRLSSFPLLPAAFCRHCSSGAALRS